MLDLVRSILTLLSDTSIVLIYLKAVSSYNKWGVMKNIFTIILGLGLGGCVSTDFHPKQSDSPKTAIIYSTLAILKGEIIDSECDNGHPEDQISCKKRRNKKN